MKQLTGFAVVTSALWLAMAGACSAHFHFGGPAPILGAGPAGLAVLGASGAGFFGLRALRKRKA
jgi:hypothetical protein